MHIIKFECGIIDTIRIKIKSEGKLEMSDEGLIVIKCLEIIPPSSEKLLFRKTKNISNFKASF